MSAPGSDASTLSLLGKMLESRTGQQLAVGRQWRVESVLRPVARSLGLSTVDALASRIRNCNDQVLEARVVEALLNNETSFFRDPSVLNVLTGPALDHMRAARQRTRKLRLWSAGCSTGQEAYSLAIMLSETPARWNGWSISIAATDISAAAIARAKAGRYSQFEVQRGLPVRSMLKWFEQDGDEWIVDDGLRRMVRFAQHNLLNPAPGEFDIILCRNVLMYFAAPIRRAVFERLREALAPGGLLLLGAGETAGGQTKAFALHSELRGLYEHAMPSRKAERFAASL